MKITTHLRRRNRLLRGLALGLAVAAVVAPAGQAKHDVGGATGESSYVPFVSDFPKPAEATRPTA